MAEKKVNRWSVFGAGWVIIFFAASAAIFSVFAKPMIGLRGWTMTDFSLSFTIYTLFLSILGIFSGRVADAYGAKKNMYVGGVLFGLGWFFTGKCETITQLYLVYGVLAGSGGGIVYNAALTTALRWFPDKRGKVSGMLLASASVGPFMLAPFASVLIERFGVVTAFEVLGVLFVVGIAAVGWMMELAPAGYQPEGWTPPTGTQAAAGRDYAWQEMLRAPLFYTLLVIFICASTAGTMMINSASVIAQTQLGVAATTGALVVSASTLSNFVGRLSFGVIYDKLGGFLALLVSFALTIAALLLIGTAQTMPVFLVCVVLLGFAFGGLLVVFPPITSSSFGAKNLGVNYGIMFLGYAGGAFVGPRLSSYFLDATGTFNLAYLSAAGVATFGVVLAVLLMVKQRQKAKVVSSDAA